MSGIHQLRNEISVKRKATQWMDYINPLCTKSSKYFTKLNLVIIIMKHLQGIVWIIFFKWMDVFLYVCQCMPKKIISSSDRLQHFPPLQKQHCHKSFCRKSVWRVSLKSMWQCFWGGDRHIHCKGCQSVSQLLCIQVCLFLTTWGLFE